MKNFINFLPPWVETNIQPAFYDKESGSCLQQTARMYAKVNQLVRIANEQYATIDEYIAKFVELKDYVEDYFDNLDVQQEINNKLNSMAEDGSLQEILQTILTEPLAEMRSDIDSFEASVNTTVTTIDRKVSSAIGSTPIAVSDVSDMTDTTKMYVLTTNGNWYYWNGIAWTSGGTYQSTGIADGAVKRSNLNFTKRTGQLYNNDNPTVIKAHVSSGTFVSSNSSYTVVIPASPNTQYFVRKPNKGQKFAVWETTAQPAVGVSAVVEHGNTNNTNTRFFEFKTGANTNYLAIFAYNSGQDIAYTFDDIYSELMVNSGDLPLAYEPYSALDLLNVDMGNNIRLGNLKDAQRTYQLYDVDNSTVVQLIGNNDMSALSANGASTSIVLPCDANTKYTVTKFVDTTKADRLCIYTTTDYPASGVTINEVSGDNNPHTDVTSRTITTGASDNYLVIFVHNANANPNITKEEVLKNTLVYQGDADEHDAYASYYVLPASIMDMQNPTIEPTAIKVNPEELCDLSFIKSITACGDSYTHCGVYQDGEWRGGELSTSWIGMLGKKNGIEVSKCARGGMTTRTYLTDANCLPKALAEEPADMYYLGLGINDCTQYGTSYIGQVSDINDADWTQNSDTFYGNYGKIIQQLKNHAPNARFIMITVMRPDSMNPNYSTFSNAIKGIANHYGFPYIEPIKDQAFAQPVLTYLQSNHPTYAGWNAISRIIERQTSKVINNNMSYFNLINL